MMRKLALAALAVTLAAVVGCGKKAQPRTVEAAPPPSQPGASSEQPAPEAKTRSAQVPRLSMEEFVNLFLDLGEAARGATSPAQAPQVSERTMKVLEKYGLTPEQFREETQYWMGDPQRSQQVFKAMAEAAQKRSR